MLPLYLVSSTDKKYIFKEQWRAKVAFLATGTAANDDTA